MSYISFESEDTFNITGRGEARSIDLKNADKDTLIALACYGLYKVYDEGETIRIDGDLVQIRGIESFALPLSSLPAKPTFGLLIKRV